MTLGLHIEPTSRCTLACPRCERTYFQNKFKKKNFSIVDLDIQALVDAAEYELKKDKRYKNYQVESFGVRRWDNE